MPKQKTEAAEADTAVEGREDDNEAAEDDAAVAEVSTDEASGIVCGRCGKPFTDDQLEKGIECTHWRCPIN